MLVWQMTIFLLVFIAVGTTFLFKPPLSSPLQILHNSVLEHGCVDPSSAIRYFDSYGYFVDVPPEIQEDRTFLIEAVRMDPGHFSYASQQIRSNKSFLYDMFSTPAFASGKYRFLDIPRYPAFEALYHVDLKLLNDEQFLQQLTTRLSDRDDITKLPVIFNECKEWANWIDGNRIGDDKESIIGLTSINPRFLLYASSGLRRDKGFLFRLFFKLNSFQALPYVHVDLLRSRDFLVGLSRQITTESGKWNFYYNLSYWFKNDYQFYCTCIEEVNSYVRLPFDIIERLDHNRRVFQHLRDAYFKDSYEESGVSSLRTMLQNPRPRAECNAYDQEVFNILCRYTCMVDLGIRPDPLAQSAPLEFVGSSEEVFEFSDEEFSCRKDLELGGNIFARAQRPWEGLC